MRRRISLIGLWAMIGLLAPPFATPSVWACDTEVLNAQLTAVCRAGLDPVLDLLRALAPQATGAEAEAMARATARAIQDCDSGDPEQGARASVQLARLAGRIEARLDSPPALWPDRLAQR